ncbi:MAG: hypothetical protein EXS36_15370 [Pedosphaera sp.]|nr:hypothetical protein [Pedosphaera sp.]
MNAGRSSSLAAKAVSGFSIAILLLWFTWANALARIVTPTDTIPTSPQKTRVWDFSAAESGHHPVVALRNCGIATGSDEFAYETASGRPIWPNRDPIGEGDGPNLYAFVRNRPMNYGDIDGRTGWDFPPQLNQDPEFNQGYWQGAGDALLDAVSALLTAMDLELGGPTGEGIAPAAAIQCLKRCPSPQKVQSAVDKIRNILKDHLKPGPKGDISGTVGDMVGRLIPKPGGGTFDHIKEMQDTFRGPRKHMDPLKNCKDPADGQALKDAEDAVKVIENAIKGAAYECQRLTRHHL